MTAAAANPLLGVIEAFNDRDVERALSFIDVDCAVHEVPTGERWRGQEGVREEFERWSTALPDGEQKVLNMIVTDGWVVVEGTLGGTHSGPFVTADATIPPTGKKFEFPFCTVARVENGKEVETTHYYDLGTIMRQLEGSA